MNTDREEFEKWYKFDTMATKECDLLARTNDPGEYYWFSTRYAWRVWKARQPEIDVLKERIADIESMI